MDEQVKLRGHRIEPGEVESVLRRHPGVRDVVVVLCGAGEGTKQLVAFFVPHRDDAPSPEELRCLARTHLPGYMVPSAFVQNGALPLLPNGKVDRRALAALPITVPRGVPEAGEMTPVEEITASVWAELLRLERIGRNDDFFDLGGHSLLAAQVVARLRRCLEVDLAVRCLFEHPTVAALSEVIESLRRENLAVRLPPVARIRRRPTTPLVMAPGAPLGAQPRTPRKHGDARPVIEGALDTAALRLALTAIVRRHEALRTLFREDGGQVRQMVQPPGPFDLETVDASGGDVEKARELVKQRTAHPPALEREAPFRAELLRLRADEHWLVIGVHHIAYDGGSMEILFRELAEHYRRTTTGDSAPPAEPPQQADFAVWQRSWLHPGSPVFLAQLAYWKEKLARPLCTLRLPCLRAAPGDAGEDSGVRTLELPLETTAVLEALSRSAGAHLFMTLVAALDGDRAR